MPCYLSVMDEQGDGVKIVACKFLYIIVNAACLSEIMAKGRITEICFVCALLII